MTVPVRGRLSLSRWIYGWSGGSLAGFELLDIAIHRGAGDVRFLSDLSGGEPLLIELLHLLTASLRIVEIFLPGNRRPATDRAR